MRIMKLMTVIGLVLLVAGGFCHTALAQEIILSMQTNFNQDLLVEYVTWINSLYPKVKVTIAPSGSGEVKTLIAAGMTPVAQKRGTETYFEDAEIGLLTDISKYLQVAGVKLDDYFPNAINALKYKGHIYALPAEGKPEIIYYNRNILANAGLVMPPSKYGNPEWTWDYLRQAARKITKDTNGDGEPDIVGVNGMPYRVGPAFLGAAWGARWFDEDYNFTGNTPEMRNALNFFRDWFAEGTIKNTSLGVFRGGNVGFRLSEVTQRIQQVHETGMDWGIAPVVTGHIPVIFMDNLRFFQGAQTELGMNILLPYLTDPDWAIKNALAENGVPTLRTAITSWMKQLPGYYTPSAIETIIESMNMGIPRGADYGPQNSLQKAISDNLVKLIETREISMEQFFENIAAAGTK
jgi:hypothetical protein